MEKQVPKYFWSDLKNLVCALLGLCYFFCLIISDARGACKKWAHWIPGKALILSALTIQALSYMDTMSVSISDEPNIQEVAMLLGNHLLIDSGRLIVCVFMGYLLPGMACSGSGDQWGDIRALAISLFSGIASEIYFLHRCKYLFNYIHSNSFDYDIDYDFEYVVLSRLQQQPSFERWYIASSLGIVVSVIFLLLLLGCTIPAGITIRGILSERIVAALSENGRQDKFNEFEEEVFKSWLVARAFRPDYVIARSVLSSATGMVVTLRIVFSLLKFTFLKYKGIIQYEDGLDHVRQATLLLQYLFVLVGWIAICWRWITAVHYFPKSNKIRSFFLLEDFWRRGIIELKYDWQNQIANLEEEMSNDSTFSGNFVRYLQVGYLTLSAKIAAPVFLILQTLVVFSAKACWFLSRIVIGNQFVRRCLVTVCHSKEFCEYNKFLERVGMPQETPDQLWIANKKSMKQTRKHMADGVRKGKGCQDLIDFIRDRPVNEPEFEKLPIVESYFPSMDKMCWEMTAVSYFKIIVKLFPEHVDEAKNWIGQAADIMNFLDSADIRENEMSLVNSLGKAADREFKKAKKSISSGGNIMTVEDARNEIDKLMNEEPLEEKKLLEQDATDLKKIAISYSLHRVCKHLLKPTGDNLDNMREMIVNDLRNLIGYCVLQVRAQLVKNCIEWARVFEEDRLWKAVYLAGKVKVVLEQSNVHPKPEESSTSLVPNSAEATDT